MSNWEISVRGFVCIVLLLSAFHSKAQKLGVVVLPDTLWNSGAITLNGGEVLEGEVFYNDVNDVVAFRNGRASHAFGPRNVTYFEYTDKRTGIQRNFYTLTVKEGITRKPAIFELLIDLQSFAVVSRVDLAAVDRQRDKALRNAVNVPLNTVVTQTERIYVMANDGSLTSLMTVEAKIRDRAAFERIHKHGSETAAKQLKKCLVDPGYSKMRRYANERNLRFDVKEDLRLLLDFYRDTSVRM